MENAYQNKSLVDLRNLAKERGMSGISALKKQELIEALLAREQGEQSALEQAETAKQHRGEQSVPEKRELVQVETGI